mmetsp:Transcript_28542/g.40256  ORF Transcript_28542/g.40256 Transcript_28542/m.40256 type:complete len:169 (+) Transcript_28542:1-507(+)
MEQYLEYNFDDCKDPYEKRVHMEKEYRKAIKRPHRDFLILHILDTIELVEFGKKEEYLRNGHGFVLMYSINSRESFESLNSLIDLVMLCKTQPSKNACKVPFVLVGNKCDLENERQVPTQEGIDLAKKLNCPFFQASAKDRVNIEQIFQELILEVGYKAHSKDTCVVQ